MCLSLSPYGREKQGAPPATEVESVSRSITFRGNARSKPRTLPKRRGRVRHPKKLTPHPNPVEGCATRLELQDGETWDSLEVADVNR